MFIGIPAGIQGALYCFANVLITSTVNSYGADATTGISIANQFDGILYQVALAPSYAVAPYIAQNMGARNLKRVKQTVLRAVLITTAFGASLGSLSAIFSEQLSSIMSSNPAVIAYSGEKMIVVSSTYFICGINEINMYEQGFLDKHILVPEEPSSRHKADGKTTKVYSLHQWRLLQFSHSCTKQRRKDCILIKKRRRCSQGYFYNSFCERRQPK